MPVRALAYGLRKGLLAERTLSSRLGSALCVTAEHLVISAIGMHNSSMNAPRATKLRELTGADVL